MRVGARVARRADVGSNNAGDRGADAVARATRRCERLERLGVAANDIGPEGARAIAPALRDHRALRELHATGNRIGDRGAAAIGAAIRAPAAPFATLALGENHNLTAAAAKSLAGAFAASTTLADLNLAKAMIGAEGRGRSSRASSRRRRSSRWNSGGVNFARRARVPG